MSIASDMQLQDRLQQTLLRTREHLLSLRGPHGHWEGELSASALSTATAVVALESYLVRFANEQLAKHDTHAIERLIQAGRDWLVKHQNADGGWGDTIVSYSNISTTALVWGALRVRFGATSGYDFNAQAEKRCRDWISSYVGSIEPMQLSQAITARYGKDRTFSVPILTTLALTGRLGPEAMAWRLIPHLPFELAAFPHQMFAMLKLPVVSYALPALIAMGQVHHHRQPTWNPLIRWFRSLVWERTQRVLVAIQPSTGGFLEATPLTSFVVLTLLGAKATPRSVIDNGIDFLIRSVRDDGSWPIDTNLATWTTTLSINALSKGDTVSFDSVRDWILDQQYHVEHPFTHAKPGGWAWTDLSGGVPDADDTSGALLAVKKLAPDRVDVASQGIKWLLDLQNRDGGVPTFCKGWGALPFDRSSTDITAHAIRSWLAWYDNVGKAHQRAIDRGLTRAIKYIERKQQSNGAWAPLWFGNQNANPEENLVYGTSRVLLACAAMAKSKLIQCPMPSRAIDAVRWMIDVQNNDGGWGSEQGIVSSTEETGLAVESLCAVVDVFHELRTTIESAIARGVEYLMIHTQDGREFQPSPIGFYFAKLWYYEKMYPVVYTLAALESASRWSNSNKGPSTQ